MGIVVNLVGQKFGKLSVESRAEKITGGRQTFWACSCDCGNKFMACTANLRSGVASSCGCERQRTSSGDDYTGRRIGIFTVVNRVGVASWSILCDCGNTITVPASQLKARRSCGCYKAEGARKAMTSHGEGAAATGRTIEYKLWKSIRARCYIPSASGYQNYGGRGIRMCERWDCYENFLSDMGRRPSPEYSIDRIDPNGNYEPGNCRWADAETQANNKQTSVMVTFLGVTMTVTRWQRALLIDSVRFKYCERRGMSNEDIVAFHYRQMIDD